MTSPPQAPKRDSFARLMAIWILILATVWLGDRFVRSLFLASEGPRLVTPRGELGADEQHTVALFEAAAPSVVYIFAEDKAPATSASGERSANAGSGVVWDKLGNVVTNYHVVAGAARVRVRLDTGESIIATLVGAAPDQDLAVVRLGESRAQLRPVSIGESKELRVGQSVYAIGNPFGLDRTLTKGIISALDRRLPTNGGREIAGAIQTDAAINPGNSGGPLLDSAGRLIGINTAILSSTGAFAGVGFAVPIDIVNRVVPALIRDGRVPRPGIGVRVGTEDMTARLGVAGVIVAGVERRSNAERAGLIPYDREAGILGDVITHVDGHPVRTVAELAAALDRAGIGRQTVLSVVRGGRSRSVTLTVMDIDSAS